MRPINLIAADHYSSPHETRCATNPLLDPSLERDFVNSLCKHGVELPWIDTRRVYHFASRELTRFSGTGD